MGHRTEEHKYVPHTVVVGTAVVGKKVGARGIEKPFSAKAYEGGREMRVHTGSAMNTKVQPITR